MTPGATATPSDGMPVVPHRIVSERLVMRAYEVSDAEALAEAVQADHVRLREWLPWAWDEPQTIDARRNLLTMFRYKFDAGEDFTMGIFDRTSGTLLGGTGLHRRGVADTLEVGYWISKSAEGKGLVREAAAALSRVALELGFASRVEIRCEPANVRSSRVPESLGFALEDTRVDTCGGDQRRTMTEIWAVDAGLFASSPAATFARPALFGAAGESIEWPV